MANKITYADKVGINPKTTHINQVWDDDMNEIKTKHNLNDDRITTVETDKANISGDTFTGIVVFDDRIEFTQGTVTWWLYTSTNRLLLRDNTNAVDVIDFRNDRVRFVRKIVAINETNDFGTEGQFNSIIIFGDTGENVTITKDLAGTTTFENTNNESFVFLGGINNSSYDITTKNLASLETVKTGAYTYANLLTTITAPAVGMRTFVTDATATTFNSIVAGGGANFVPVFYDGTNWRIG